jgi:hypothetical protein
VPFLRGVRARLALALVALVAVTAAVLGIGATVFVDARLHRDRLSPRLDAFFGSADSADTMSTQSRADRW